MKSTNSYNLMKEKCKKIDETCKEYDMQNGTAKKENDITTEETKEQVDIREYLSSFDESEKKAYLLAKDHLGSSFHITRSNGFIEWQKNKNVTSL